jgi:polyisoprenoid-binding protein YceI
MPLRQLVAALVVLSSSALFAADNYKIDAVHSFVIFRIKHLDVSYTYGRFNEPTGTIAFDAADPTKSSINLEIKTENVDTHNERRDAHLKRPDFFDAKQFPLITFKSTEVKAAGENKFDVTGDLSLHGVTKSITVTLEKTGEAQTQMGYRIGFESTVDLKRSDYGMTGMIPAAGDDVKLRISLEAVKQ